MEAQHEPARYSWPDGFREHLRREFDGFSPLITRVLEDNGASVFRDGPYGRSKFWSRLRSKLAGSWAREYLWPS